MELNQIIADYRAKTGRTQDQWIQHCAGLPLNIAIRDAASASLGKLGTKGDKHPHQWILKQAVLTVFGNNIAQKEAELKAAKTFHEMYLAIGSARIKGVADLTVYDTTCRIAATRGLKPDLIYLHRGARKGAEKLLRRKLSQSFLERSELPLSWQQTDLECWELEDILCRYKGRRNGVQSRSAGCRNTRKYQKQKCC